MPTDAFIYRTVTPQSTPGPRARAGFRETLVQATGLQIFRDEGNLNLSAHLWGGIQQAVEDLMRRTWQAARRATVPVLLAFSSGNWIAPAAAQTPRLQYQPPPFFCCGGSGVPDVWIGNDPNSGTLSLYPFAPFTGDFRDVFSRTLFSGRIPLESRESRTVRRPAGDMTSVAGAEAAIALGFSAIDGQGRLIEHVRIAIMSQGEVALVDFAVQADRATNTTRTQQGFLAFLKSLSVASDAAISTGVAATDGASAPAHDRTAAAAVAIHTLRYQQPPFFCCGGSGVPDVWIASVSPGDEGIISIYQFEPFTGNFRDVFLRTRFSDRIAVDKREMHVLGLPVVETMSVPGAEQSILLQFAAQDSYGRLAQHVRLALLTGNSVAIVNFQTSRWETSTSSRQGFAAFFKTLSVASEAVVSAGDDGISRPSRSPVDFAGLYTGTSLIQRDRFGQLLSRRQWRLDSFWYLLSADGRVQRGAGSPTAPNGDINRFDFETARKYEPFNAGTYVVRGERLTMRFGGETVDAIFAPQGVLKVLDEEFRKVGR